MTPCRVEEYVGELFHETSVTVQVVSDENTLLQEYPLFAAVNRAASTVPRYRGRIIFLTYEPQNSASILETILLVGKGVTYDTGSADVKAVDGMIGESGHKSGAGACVGFLQVQKIQSCKIQHLNLIKILYTIIKILLIKFILYGLFFMIDRW